MGRRKLKKIRRRLKKVAKVATPILAVTPLGTVMTPITTTLPMKETALSIKKMTEATKPIRQLRKERKRITEPIPEQYIHHQPSITPIDFMPTSELAPDTMPETGRARVNMGLVVGGIGVAALLLFIMNKKQ